MDHVAQIKAKHKKYLIVIFILSIIAMVVLPSTLKMEVPIVYMFLTFVRYGYLSINSTNNLSNYLISEHSLELDELKINTSKIGFDRIQT